MLLPIRIVESILLKSEDKFITNKAFLSPEFAIFLSLILFRLEKAVSVAEKYADNIMSTPMENMMAILLESIMANCSRSFYL